MQDPEKLKKALILIVIMVVILMPVVWAFIREFVLR